MQKGNIRLIALLLILVFSQKGGARLWLHIYLHTVVSSRQGSHTIQWQRVQPVCTCLDDLTMPMTAARHIELSQPRKDYLIYSTLFSSPVFLLTRHYPSLRGPPVIA